MAGPLTTARAVVVDLGRAVVLVVLVVRSRFLCTARFYEQGDAGRTRS